MGKARGPTKRELPQMVEMALEAGYSPGKFTIARLIEDIEQVESWIAEFKRYGRIEGWEDKNFRETKVALIEYAADIAKRESAILDYYHAKKKAIEHSGTGEGGAFKFTVEGL